MTVFFKLGVSAVSLACGFLVGALVHTDSTEAATRGQLGQEGLLGRTLFKEHIGDSPDVSSRGSVKPTQVDDTWEWATDVLSRAAEGEEPEGDAFSTACSAIARRSKSETLAWYQRFVELGRFDQAKKVFFSIEGSWLFADVDFGELAAPLLSECSSEKINLLESIASTQVWRNPVDFPDWVRTVPEELKTPVLNSILDSADYSEPAVQGITKLLEELPETPERDQLYTRLWERLFDNDPQKTFGMAVEGVTAAEAEADAPPLSALAEKWQKEDPYGLLIRLRSLPPVTLNQVLERLALDNPKLHEQLETDLAIP